MWPWLFTILNSLSLQIRGWERCAQWRRDGQGHREDKRGREHLETNGVFNGLRRRQLDSQLEKVSVERRKYSIVIYPSIHLYICIWAYPSHALPALCVFVTMAFGMSTQCNIAGQMLAISIMCGSSDISKAASGYRRDGSKNTQCQQKKEKKKKKKMTLTKKLLWSNVRGVPRRHTWTELWGKTWELARAATVIWNDDTRT